MENFNLFLNKEITKGSLNDFSSEGKVMIGGELAYNLKLTIGDKINIISSSFIDTPFGSIPSKKIISLVAYLIADFMNLIKIYLSRIEVMHN